MRHARIEPGMRVFDFGCGMGTLIMAQRAHPGATFPGLDGDPRVLAAAADEAPGLGIHWELGLANNRRHRDVRGHQHRLFAMPMATACRSLRPLRLRGLSPIFMGSQ